MGFAETAKKVWDGINHLSTVVWLVGLAGGSATAQRAASMMPGGWLQNPFLPLAWFFSTLAVVVVIGKGIEFAWKRLFPVTLDITPYGGEDATLLLRPGESGEFYGTAWLVGDATGRHRPFTLNWVNGVGQCKKVRAGDKAALVLARYSGRTAEDAQLQLIGDGAVVRTWLLRDHARTSSRWTDGNGALKNDLDWVAVRVELRAKELPNTWSHVFRFRLTKFLVFEVEDITQSASRTVAPSRP
jgi:hypothetical protein